jgi:UDP-3-O-[3-hydroxymyristoyl] N-acetylglucosamine deacetylase
MQYQITIAGCVTYEGIGLHSGKPVKLTLRPAAENTGLIFVRADLENRPQIFADAKNVTAALRATTISNGAAKVFTIEHLLSALHVWGIDNCYIELDSEEPPVADGSSLVFFELIKKAGLKEQSALKKYTVIDRTYIVREADKFVMALPYDGFRVSFTSINEHELVGIQYGDFEITPEIYAKEIAPARTIAYEKEVEALYNMGLGLGGTLENVIVYNDEKWLTALRYKDELVRHKILDVIGDLRLAGCIRGHIVAAKSSHALNTRLAAKIAGFADEK